MQTVSVVIPSYNRKDFIAQAIDSVLKQALPKGWDMEIIVADDGSTDNTKQILKPYINKNLIQYYQLPHSGKPAVPRNYAIKKAKGELVAFQDSDDLWVKDKLLKQIPVFKDPGVMMSFGQAEIITQAGKKTGTLVVNKKTLLGAKGYENILQENPVSTLTVMARRDAILKVGGFNENSDLRAIEDYELWLRIAAAYPSALKPINTTLAYYRKHDQNISMGDTLKGITNAMKIYDYSWLDNNLSAKQRQSLQENMTIMNDNYTRHIKLTNPNAIPKVSVLMSVYNGERFLREAIDGIINQTFEDFEFLIINDGSSDASSKIISSYKDKRIRVIDQSNHGFIYSLNKGVELSLGDYIARMDQDDISLHTRLEKQVKLLDEDPNLGAISTFFELIDFKDSKPLGTTMVFPTNNIDIKRAMYVHNPMAHGSTTFRKEAWRQVGQYRAAYHPPEDYDLWRRIAKNWNLAIVPEVLFQYRINNPDSMSQKNIDISTRHINKIQEELMQESIFDKNLMNTLKDYKKINSGQYGRLANKVKEEYINLQMNLAKKFLENFLTREAFAATLFVVMVRPTVSLELLRKYPRCILVSTARKLNLARHK